MKAEKIDYAAYVRSTTRRWYSQYFRNGQWQYCYAGDAEKIYGRLLACGNTAEEINGIIGNDSWTGIYCDGCEKRVDCDVVYIGESRYGSDSCKLCRRCVVEALAVFDGEAP